MNKIWGFGTAAIDIRLKTAEYGEQYKDKLLAQEAVWMGGGSTSNFLVQAARLGCEVGWFGKLGEDAVGAEIQKMLRAENVDLSATVISPDVISPFNVAVYAGEHRRRIGGFLLPNAMAQINDSDIAHYVSALSEGDCVLVEVGEIPLETCIRFCKAAHEKAAKLVLDVDLDPIKQCGGSLAQAKELFAAVDYLMPNITSLETMYPDMDAEEVTAVLAKEYGCMTISTMGDNGAAWAGRDGKVNMVPGISIEPVDTVGAGDAFHGGFVAGLGMGLDTERAVMLGNICGAHNCLSFGARNGMIYKKELEKYGFIL